MAMLNWIWQAAALGLATALLLHPLRRAAAATRYQVLWTALVATLLLPVWPSRHLLAAPDGVAPETSTGVAWLAQTAPSRVDTPRWTASGALVAAWAVWALFHAVQGGASLLLLRRMRRRCAAIAPEREAGLPTWAAVRDVRFARVAVSPDVSVAALLAGRPALIAVAPALLRGLDTRDLDRVVLHEWAHARRGDQWAVGLQYAIRACVGWHPAVWWLDRRLHVEREMACDETVVALTGDAPGYARCLTTLAEFTVAQRDLPALALTGSSSLRERVVRLLQDERREPRTRARAVAAMVMLAVAAGSVSLAAVRFAGDASQGAAAASFGTRDTRATLPVRRVHDKAGSGVGDGPPSRGGDEPGGRVAAATAAGARRTGADAALGAADPLASAPAVVEMPVVPIPEALAASAATSAMIDDDAGGESAPLLTATHPAAAYAVPPASAAGEGGGAEDGGRDGAEPSWLVAAEGGKAIGRVSRRAALATAGFFSRVSRHAAQTF